MTCEDMRIERLAEMTPPLEDQSRFLRELVVGFEKGQIFLTAFDLGIFNSLKEKKTIGQISEQCLTHPRLTEKLLDVLVSMGLIIKEQGMYITEPHLVPFLVKGEPYFARYLDFSKESRNQWFQLKDALLHGPKEKEQKHEHIFDKETLDWIARGTMLGRLQTTLKVVRDLPEFKSARKIMDLGGGHGLFGIGFAQENPQTDVVIFDKPDVTPITQSYIARYGLENRVKTMGGDYLIDPIGRDYDIVFESCSFGGNIDQARMFFRNVSSSLKKGGLFISNTFTIDDQRTAPLQNLIWDLKEEITGDGHMHLKTNAEIFQILHDEGLTGEKIIDLSRDLSMPMRLVIARK